jgi:hypothetical protein
MEQVYGNATLTLAFTDSSRFGAVSGASFSKASSRDFGVLDTRGWAFQESLLSPRVLFITKNGLYWECLENSMSEKCPVGIPCPTDGFYAVDTRKIKMTMLQPMQQPKLDEASRERLLCMWRRGIVEEYTKRQLTFEEDRVMAAAGVTGRLRLVFDDICLVGVWKRDALRSLFWHAVEPSRRPKRMIFPSWSWYSVQGPVVYTTWTPFTSGATQPRAKLKDDMGNYRASIDDIVCKQDDVRSNVYWGQVILRGLGFKAFFSPGDGVSLYIPRRLGAEQELVEDLRRGRPNAAKHDAGPQPEHSYIVERARVDTLAFPGHKTYREVVCVVIVDNDNDGFPLALILEKVDADGDSHPGSARGMGEFLKRRLVPKQAGSSRGTRYERVGAVAIDTRMVHLKGHDAAMDHSDEMGWFGTFTII